MKAFLKTNIIPILSILLWVMLVNPEASYALKTKTVRPVKITAFNKVVVSGNVEVLLVWRPRVGIHYSDDNEGTVKVIQKDNELHITATDNLKTKIVVYTNDIYRIEAQHQAIIRSQGGINVKFLQIIMKDDAQADINVKAEGLYTLISDHAVLKLEGNTKSFTLLANGSSKLITNNFVSQKMSNQTETND